MTAGGEEEARPAGPDRAVLAIAAGLLILAGVVGWDAAHLKTVGGYAKIGPAAFPTLVAAGLAVIAVATAIAGWRGRFPAREHDEIAPVLWIVGGLAAQMLLLKTAGFSIATAFLFAATARGLGRGPLWFTFLVGLALSLFAWLVFALGLKLTLPAGPLEHLFR